MILGDLRVDVKAVSWSRICAESQVAPEISVGLGYVTNISTITTMN